MRRLSKHTEDAYVYRIHCYNIFNNKQHPSLLKEQHLEEFLTHLAVIESVF
ncbi:MAG: phage integrase N-terminal SAM-like domain-containing protein [Bacteroidetes bacterium]|nr:phage integrase N-terminal SAM-like domain-containing protein [Bacteroidota bacterium]